MYRKITILRPTLEQLKEQWCLSLIFLMVLLKIVYASDKSDTTFTLEVEQLFIVNKDVDKLELEII